MAANNGFIKLYRSMLEWEWYDDKSVKILWLHLILSANYAPKQWHGILINSGQLVTSLGNLSKECGLSLQSVRTAINKLVSTGEITCKSTNRYSLITLVNWQKYNTVQQPGNAQTTDNQQQYKNFKNLKNKEYTNSFENNYFKQRENPALQYQQRHYAADELDYLIDEL